MPTQPSVKPVDPAALALDRAALADEARRHAENLTTYRNLSAYYESEVVRLNAAIAEITESLQKDVPPGTDNGAHERLDLKKLLIHAEFDRDRTVDENGKLQLQIEEAEALIEDNAQALAALEAEPR
jgi:hypothetical protein